MSRENKLLILWVIFGFVFVAAVDSILYFFIHLIYFAAAELGSSYGFLTYFIPIITFITYVLATFTILQNLNYKSGSSGIYLLKFPIKRFFILTLIAIILNPITNKLSGLYAEHITTTDTYLSHYPDFYSWMNIGFGLSRWLILIFLAIIYLNKLEQPELKTEKNTI
jgi:hypothetical protein